MSEQGSPRRPLMHAIRTAAIAALVAALAYQAVGAAVFLPRFGSDDPRDVVTAHYEALRWGYRGIAESALSEDQREMRDASNYVRPMIPDELFAGDMTIEGPSDIVLHGQYAEEVQFRVTYRSMWQSEIGEPPGRRLWFVYLGRDEGEPWRILGIGTGP